MSRPRILIADDEKEHCSFVGEYLKKRGYEVDVVYDGREAVDMIMNNDYGVVFFDCNMPGRSGVELISVIAGKNPITKKVMISGYEEINKKFAEKIGVDVYMSKPIRLEDLLGVIEGGDSDMPEDTDTDSPHGKETVL